MKSEVNFELCSQTEVGAIQVKWLSLNGIGNVHKLGIALLLGIKVKLFSGL